MELVSLDYAESIEILKESWGFWSAGLGKTDYYEHNWQQLSSPWGRKNLRFFGLKEGKRLVGALKSYRLEALDHSRSYKLYGLGAVFIKEEYRGKGYGLKLLQEFISRSKEEGAQGILLFSDINSEFYQQAGFELIGCFNFRLSLPGNKYLTGVPDYQIKPFIDCDIEQLARHYNRWLKSRSYGIKRDSTYFQFKADREDYLHKNSRANWPQLQVLTTSKDSGYALFEIRSKQLRVLEVCNDFRTDETVRTEFDSEVNADAYVDVDFDENTKANASDALYSEVDIETDNEKVLWKALYEHAQNQNLEAISGWEGLLANLEPAFNLGFLKTQMPQIDSHFPLMSYTERSWSQAMVLPLGKQGIKRKTLPREIVKSLGKWQDIFPCPLLELDQL